MACFEASAEVGGYPHSTGQNLADAPIVYMSMLCSCRSSRCCDNTTRDKSLLENLENKKHDQAAVLSSYASARIYPPSWTLKWSREVKAELQRGLAQAQN